MILLFILLILCFLTAGHVAYIIFTLVQISFAQWKKGLSYDEASDWINKPHNYLGGKKPKDVIYLYPNKCKKAYEEDLQQTLSSWLNN
jgi:hypothetical protein